MSELTPDMRAAAERDDVEAINALIEAGADPNAKNYAGNTALHAAGKHQDPWGQTARPSSV